MPTSLRNDLKSLLGTLIELDQQNGRPPLLKEVLAAESVPDTTTRSRLATLVDRALIRFEGEGHGKLVRVTEDGHFAQRTGKMPEAMPYFTSGLHAGPRASECSDDRSYINSLADLLPINDTSMTYFAPIVGNCMDSGEDGLTRDGKKPIPEGADVMLKRLPRFAGRPKNGRAVHVEVTIDDSGQTVALLRDYYFDEESGFVRLVPRNPAFPITCHRDEDVDPRGTLSTIIVNDEGEPSPGAQQALAGATRDGRPISLGITPDVAHVFGQDAQNELVGASR